MEIRRAEQDDLVQLLALYTHVHDNKMPQFDEKLQNIWRDILQDKNQHIIVGVIDDCIVSSCVLIIVPNLTNNQRPYAFIENVVTLTSHRKKGYASKILAQAKKVAMEHHCYKIMLMTSSKQESTWRFYEKAGFNRFDKTAFVQWLA